MIRIDRLLGPSALALSLPAFAPGEARAHYIFEFVTTEFRYEGEWSIPPNLRGCL